MALNDATYRVFFPGVEAPSKRRIDEGFQSLNLLPVPYIDPMDVSHAVVYLASDESRYVTGSQLYVDAGTTER
ncbi:SDR family oxidoreductase [Actinomadura sp. SCN-SB]|uniref:SDR family oxidoreductase n=1 Tax=Actinomadura sp. SCN-SB TaxID=3373092 RepID=UPI003750C73A